MDRTLLEAWASVKSFRPKDEDEPPSEGGGRNPEVDFRGERRSNETHRSTTDPDARLAKKGKGKEANLCFGAHVLMDNREDWWWMCVSPRPTARRNGRRRPAPHASRAAAGRHWPFCQGCGADYTFDPRVLEVDHINPVPRAERTPTTISPCYAHRAIKKSGTSTRSSACSRSTVRTAG